jgi:hypothetical protein
MGVSVPGTRSVQGTKHLAPLQYVLFWQQQQNLPLNAEGYIPASAAKMLDKRRGGRS